MSNVVNSVKVPEVHHYDETNKVLAMSDAGDKTMKEANSLPNIDIPETGRLLAEWLAVLHHKSPNLEIGEGGNRIAKSIY